MAPDRLASLPPTFFDSPERAHQHVVAELAARVQADQTVNGILGGLPSPTFVLNQHRQIVATNSMGASLVQTLGGPLIAEGLRMGEALGCVNVPDGPGGCGTSTRCRYCGLGQANRAFTSKPVTYDTEFRLRSESVGVEASQTFRVYLAPLSVTTEALRLCTLIDITAAKNREALERIFFHDVLNTAQAISGAAVLLEEQQDPDTIEQLSHVVTSSSAKIVAEIQTQRDLLDAEDGRLVVPLQQESVSRVVADVADLYRQNPLAHRRAIKVDLPEADDVVPTNATMLSRCVSNLVKNALEASAAGECITLRVSVDPNAVSVTVHNAAMMSDEVQAQVFQRFFSTKARSGRGLGTHSVRLIVSSYLKGTVSFQSGADAGTTFVIRLPRAAGM